MSAICPAGHTSEANDYCDVCGMPIEAAVAGPGTPPAPTDLPAESPVAAEVGQPCPNCGTENATEALFCEACGYDFTTGSMPRAPAESESSAGPAATQADNAPEGGAASPAPSSPESPVDGSNQPDLEWVVEVWIDPAWYQAQDSPDPLPSPGLPDVVPLRSTSLLVGRRSVSRNINPDIDCGTDSGVSRRQAQMTTDGKRWFVEDLESANGTFVGPASEALPTDPIPVGTKYELDADDRVYVGAWTRLVIREATEEEQASLT